MAEVHYWIQIENRPWDASPADLDRMMNHTVHQATNFAPVTVTLTSPAAGSMPRTVTMFNPIRRAGAPVDALILRRYRPPAQADESDAWTVADDRKVNPWDLNERNPGENGTRGTIPGPTIECDVGDTVNVHFRNLDGRTDYDVHGRTHSLHAHGFVFEATSDGAFPLSPPDQTQPTGAEAPLWTAIGVTGTFKQGDRVPPGGTFTYRWQTISWPTTAGVWLYHDHSINDTENMALGAIGMILIHNANDNQDVDVRLPTADDPTAADPALMPGGSTSGSPVVRRPFLLPNPLPARAADLVGLGRVAAAAAHGAEGAGAPEPIGDVDDTLTPLPISPERAVELAGPGGGLLVELDPNLLDIPRLFLPRYRTPPQREVILQLYHEIQGVGVGINGRQFLGNAPTVLAGPDTVMRFGLVSMGDMFHTFHLHGHRWIIPGPHGTTPSAQQFSPQDTPVSQFEDTRTFGPANSFTFTIDGRAGSFMRAGGGSPPQALGEWHMHCHVLGHMMSGMMGSLLIVQGGEFAARLPVGRPHSPPTGGGTPAATEVHITTAFTFEPQNTTVSPGQTVRWIWDHAVPHTVTSDTNIWDSGEQSGGPPFPEFSRPFPSPGTFDYHCEIHPNMTGSVMVM